MELGWPSRLTAQLGNILIESDASKTRAQPGPERRQGRAFLADRAAENVAHLFLGAAAVPPRAPLKLRLHIVIQIANKQLSHRNLQLIS